MHYRVWLTFVAVAVGCTLGIANAQDAGKNVIASPNAPAPVGPYSQAIKVGKTVYLSGQIAIDPKTKQLMADASIEDQTRRVLENLRRCLRLTE
jgi:2-iminobutanoate/2-iminopropanoate deaminase